MARRPRGAAGCPSSRDHALLRWRRGAADAARDDPLGAAALRPRSAHRYGQSPGAVAGALRVRRAAGRGSRHRRAGGVRGADRSCRDRPADVGIAQDWVMVPHLRRPACSTGAVATAAGSKSRRVRLRSKKGRGRWKVRGTSRPATQRTDWTTVESCSRTTTIVRSGRVRVYDRERRRSVLVRAGGSYVARVGARSCGRSRATSRSVRAR